MSTQELLFDQFCSIQASFESSRHIYRREHAPGQVRRFFNTRFTSFELRRYMMHLYFSKGSFTISELVKVSDFRSNDMLRLLGLSILKGYKAPPLAFLRLKCSPPGGSTLITSAPAIAIRKVAYGPL